MEMPGRKGNSQDYRYGFQGQEKDDELKGEGNSVNYKYRMHDPRLGRFFAVDPLTADYPFYTPYSFSGNRVIDAIELEGLEPYLIFNGTDEKISIWDQNGTPDDRSDDYFYGEYDAHNNTTKSSQGKWEDGTYEMQDKKKPHTHGEKKDSKGVKRDSKNGSYGEKGIFRAKNFEQSDGKKRTGMGVHSGRENKDFTKRVTLGCIRCTQEGIDAIEEAIEEGGSLQEINIEDNLAPREKEAPNNFNPDKHQNTKEMPFIT